jgi:hypothetical protein
MSILEFIMFLIIGSIVLPNIYNQIKDIINYQPQAEFELGDLTNDICLGGICLNKCDNLNGQEVKRTGNTALLNQNNTFQAVDCGDDKVLRDLRFGGILCGEEGTDECNSGHCCYPKLCENNLDPLDGDADYETHYPTPEAKIEKKRRDGNCPYQKTVKKDTPCSGGNPGESGGCTDDGGACCEDKTCANNWNNDQNPEWGIQNTCPHQPENAVRRGNDMLKYPDDTRCDACDITECCYEQNDFCIVEANGDYNHENTNVGNVGFPSGTDLSFPGNDNTSVDLTTNYFLSKDDISQTNIQNLLSFGSESGTDDPSYGIKCEDGFKYGMCSASDASADDNTCKTHDNNQRECEAAGCSFTSGDRPRVDYSECGDADGHNIIKVNNCVNTCTANHELSDGDINYFTQTAITEGANIGSYRVNPLYDNTDKNSGQEFESGTNVRKYCNNYFGTGDARYYSYNCEGGGSYFTVNELENCNSTCGELRSQGANCSENKIYNETDPDTNSLLSNFADFNENCCIPKTCNNGSSGTEIGCRNYEKIIETESPIDSSGSELPINSNNCCERLTCSDYLDEFNRVSVEGGHEVITSENICNSGTFRPENQISFNYLNSFSPGDPDTEKYDIFKSYQDGTSQIDIGCCQQLTCQEWADNPGNIPDGSDQQSSANRYCNNNEDGINVFDMSGNFNGNSLDEVVEPGNNSCCVSSENITCRPSDELMNPAGLVGYDGYDGLPLPADPGPIEFEYDHDTSNFSSVVGDNPFSGVTCTGDGTPSLQCTRDANGDNHLYTLTGCNVEPNENVCQEGQSLANGDPKFCVLPNLQDDEHHGIVLSDFITGVSGNAIVNVRNFAHQLDNIQCENSTSHPCMSECTHDVLTTSYSGVLTERTQAGETGDYSDTDYDSSVHIHIEGCDYQNDLTGNFFTDRFYNGSNGYSECNTLYQSRSMPDGSPIDTSKINVKHFKCHCGGTQEDPDLPNYGGKLAESCDDHPSDRHIRFKYVFDDDVDYLTDDKRHITNTEALSRGMSYIQSNILVNGDYICEPGYYPYRGDTEDYCKPCTDLYKNNHPISAISERFCNSGHLFDANGNISLLRRPDIGNPEYNSNVGHQDISTLRAVRTFADGVTETNEDYSPYFGADLGPSGHDDTNSIDFMTADNFTLGTRVCDPEPDGSTACTPKVKIYGDYYGDAAEDSQFEKAKKWWRTYFNNNFNNNFLTGNDNSDILDLSSAPSETPIPDPKPILKSRIDDTGGGVKTYNGRTHELNDLFREFRNTGRSDQEYGYTYDINDITDLKKEHYLYRNNFKISVLGRVAEDTRFSGRTISTVCNNNTSDVDYIPSFNSVDSNEGECKACVNEMPSVVSTLRQNDAPFNSPGDDIVRNIDNDNNAPICSYEANMYDESYNEGNIVGFKSKTTGLIHQEAGAPVSGRGPCNDGFIYNREGQENLYEYNNGDNTMNIKPKTPYIKCMPENKMITKFCENIPDKDTCNKSFSTYLTDDENSRLSDELKGKLDTDERQMIDNIHTNGFCGWVTNVNGDGTITGECKNIYDTENGYLSHSESIYEYDRDLYSNLRSEDYSNHKSLYKQYYVFNYLSPHITSYTTSSDYNYSKLYNHQNSAGVQSFPYPEHETHNGDNIKSANDDVFNISNYGVGKGGVTASTNDDLTSLSIANTLKEGYDLHPDHLGSALSTIIPDYRAYDLNRQPLRPTRLNPRNTTLNDTMINRCHPILWDGPVDFFYESNSTPGANGGTTPKTTISSSCYLRYGSTITGDSPDRHIVPDSSGDYSIKSTPLYYNKARGVYGETKNEFSNDDDWWHDNFRFLQNNILNPGHNQEGIIYAETEFEDGQATPVPGGDSGFTDAAIFPLIDRVRGCFNDSLIYGRTSQIPSNSSLGLDADNINNEREQCIFHWNKQLATGERWEYASSEMNGCFNACLNNNECDLVRIKNIPQKRQIRCELLKWNKLPDNITEKYTRLNPVGVVEQVEATDDMPSDPTESDGAIRNKNLGGHLINADPLYDQTTRQGVVNWYERITDPERGGEMNHEVTIPDDGNYRTEFYSWKSENPTSDIREWRMNHLMESGTPGDTIEIKGRPLWKTSNNDNEMWFSMNKIRAPKPTGKIGEILTNINDHELPDNGIQPIDSGETEVFGVMDSRRSDGWASGTWSIHGLSGATALVAINEGQYYHTNDSSHYPDKFNEKTVIDSSSNHKQCPPGTYVQEDNDGNYKCSQVINECTSCRDIYDYHLKKGDFEGMNNSEKNNLINSYGGGGCSVSNDDTVSGDFMVYIDKDKWRDERGRIGVAGNEGAMGPGSTTTNIMDSTGYVTKKTNEPSSTFPNQHNLMAKTPDGNIIDAEKCMCPETKLVNAWIIGSGANRGHGIAVCA